MASPAPFRGIGEALAWLDSLTDYERQVPDRRALPSLSGMAELTAALASPELDLEVLHITGTNGKGSTAAMATALLVARGFRVGTYTSPNLERVNERIALNGEPIDDAELVDALGAVMLAASTIEHHVTRFEALTAAALWWFADLGVDVAVVEVGMGGSFDCTNVVTASVAVITSVALDHVEVLGRSEAEIAADKAGIAEPGAPLLVGRVGPEARAAIEAAAAATGAGPVSWLDEQVAVTGNQLAVGGRLVSIATPFGDHEDLLLPLHGAHQAENLAIAVAAVEALCGEPLGEGVLTDALADLEVPGRLEVLGHQPLVVLDGAHNPAGMGRLAEALAEAFNVEGERRLVVGMLAGRDPAEMLAPLAPLGFTEVVVCAPDTPRAMAAEEVGEAAAQVLDVDVVVAGSVADAVAIATEHAEADDLVVVAGSFYVVGDARGVLRNG